jgi:hypothetical protein
MRPGLRTGQIGRGEAKQRQDGGSCNIGDQKEHGNVRVACCNGPTTEPHVASAAVWGTIVSAVLLSRIW